MEFKKVIKEMWKTPRGKAIVKLCAWMLFFLVLFLLMFVVNLFNADEYSDNVSNDENVVSDESNQNYIEALNDILTINYSYVYEVVSVDETYTYIGNVVNGLDTGSKLNNDLVVNYVIENDITYIIEGENKINYNIYENLNSTFLNLESIYNVIINNEYTVLNDVYTYFVDDVKYEIYYYEDVISKIIIYSDYTYNLKLTY